MEIGLIGLGKMGGNMRTRLRNAGHTVVGYDRNPDVADVGSLAELVEALPSPKVVWVMVPAGDPTRQTVAELGDLLSEGDVIVDGGNSRWTDDLAAAELLAPKGIGYVDCGVSGGVWGLENGYALMYGGAEDDIAKVQPAFDALRPEGDFGSVHAGGVGAGHFSKMVHNGIEYAIMQAYAEGWELLEATDTVENVTEVFRSWREGTVIRSWLLDLMVAALDEDPGLSKITGYAEDSGEGRWTVEAGIEHAVATPAITAALYARFVSRQDDSPAMKAIAAMRNQFGGHATRTAPPPGGDASAADAPCRHQRRLIRPTRVRRPPHAPRLPLVRRPRPRAGAGRDRVRRPQRAGQDQHRRGDRLPLPPGLPPGRRGRTAGAGRVRAGR